MSVFHVDLYYLFTATTGNEAGGAGAQGDELEEGRERNDDWTCCTYRGGQGRRNRVHM